MSESDESPVEPLDDDSGGVMMRRWERWVATLLGLALDSLGVLAVFKTSNQAGSALLLLIGAAFLLIGLQGTPLIKIGGSTANVELDKRRRFKNAEKAIERAKSKENPDVAQGMIEVATIMEPQLALSSHTQASLYEDRIEAALREKFDDVRRATPSDHHDFTVITPMGETKVEVKYRKIGNFRRQDIADVVHKHHDRNEKLVIVTNAPLSGEVRHINGTGTLDNVPVEVVTWNDETHSPLLQRAILRGIN